MKLLAQMYGLTAFLLLLAPTLPLFAQQQTPPGISTRMIVTIEPGRGKTVPPIVTQDLSLTEAKEKRAIVSLTPCQGAQAALQLMLLIDDSAEMSFNTEISVLKQWVKSLPPATDIAIGYMHNGTNQMVQSMTKDHNAAANTIRVPYGHGGADVSPYDSLADAIKKWPKTQDRREVLMISSGIEGLGGGYNPENPYVLAGINEAQKEGIVVYTIYTPAVGHFGHVFWIENWGVNFLSQLSYETGGESYFIGFTPPPSFDPFLKQIDTHLNHQFFLTFSAKPQQKAGLQPVKVRVIEKNANAVSATQVYVRAGL